MERIASLAEYCEAPIAHPLALDVSCLLQEERASLAESEQEGKSSELELSGRGDREAGSQQAATTSDILGNDSASEPLLPPKSTADASPPDTDATSGVSRPLLCG